MLFLSLFLSGFLALCASQAHATPANPNVQITVHNNLTTNKTLYVYVLGIASSTGSQSMLQTDNTWALLNAGASPTPIKIPFNIEFAIAPHSATTLTLPSYANASRLYAAEGAPLAWEMVRAADGITTTVVQPVPTTPGTVVYDTRWGFVEFTSNAAQFFVNLSFVDFVSLPIGISGTDAAGVTHVVPGLLQQLPPAAEAGAGGNVTTGPNVTQRICLDLEAQALHDGQPWGALCIYPNTTTTAAADDDEPKTPLRILSPQTALQQNIVFASPSYYDAYIAKVWAYYATAPLYIDTQIPGVGASGANRSIVTCQVDAGDGLACSNTTGRMPRPSTADVWGCNTGAFALDGRADEVYAAVVPRVCAAFTRATLLVDGGDVQPGPGVESFYQAEVTNHFARIVHAREVVGGYAFSYDDVAVAGADQDGDIQVASMETLEVWVGG